MSLYTDLIAAGVPVSNWQSDLYFEDNETSRQIRKLHPSVRYSGFTNQITKTRWVEAPFQFDPFWEKRKKG